jgi:hypothetical protein
MLTNAQQKLKRELDELKINAALAPPKDQSSNPHKKQSYKKWCFAIIAILILIGTCSLLLID